MNQPNERIVLDCATCKTGIDAPNKGLGRATVAAWRTQHQGHDVRDLNGTTAAPAPAPKPRWVSCARDVNWTVSRYRHLITPGKDTTYCGATGLGQGVWRGNSTKPACPSCEAARDASAAR